MHQGHQVTSVQAPDWRYRHDEPRPPHSVPPAGAGGCRLHLAAAPESTKTARDFTTATLRGWHLNALIQAAVMVASELVTNAIRHGTPLAVDNEERPRVELTWWCQPSGLICVVTDRSTTPPVLAPAGRHAASARALPLRHALPPTRGRTRLSTPHTDHWPAT